MKKFLMIALTILTVSVMVLPVLVVLAAPAVPPTGDDPNIKGYFEQTRGTAGGSQETLPEVVGRIIKWVVGLIGVILVAMFIYGGVAYATSAGNEDRVETGKKIMMYSIMGILIVAIAFAATDYVINALFPEQTGI